MTGAKNRGGLDFKGDIAFDAGWDGVGCWFHRLRNVVSSNKGIFLIDDQEAGIASKTDGG